jgi:vacuolar protein sorting-associated protein 13A/C
LDAVGNVINFELCTSEGERKIWQNLALNVRLGPNQFSQVHVVTISPRTLIANRVPKRCVYMQAGLEAIVEASPDALQPAALHCDPVNLRRVRVSLDGQVWSSPFSIAEVGETFLKLDCQKGQELVKVSKVLQSGILYVAVSLEKYWPYRIVNRSSADIKFCQKGFAERLLLSGESAEFAWDDPSSTEGLLRISVLGQERNVDLASLGPSSPLSYRLPGSRERSFLGIDVSADGPTVIARFFDFDPKSKRNIFVFASEKDRLASEAESEAGSEFQVKEARDRTEVSFRLNMAGIGVSLIGQDLSEFLYVCVKGLEVRCELSRLFQTLGFKLKWLQIDNQLFDYTHPILVYPSVIKRTDADMDEHPTLNVGIIQSRMDRGVHYFKYCGILLQELTIELGEELLRKLIQFAQFESIRPWHGPLLQEADFVVPSLKTEAVDTKLMYFELLQIHPIKINVSFSRIEQSAESEGGTMVASSYNPLSPILTLFSMAGSNISDAPLKFNSLLLEHPLVSSEALKNRIAGYYIQQAIVQMHVLLGSIDMLGNPVGLVTTMGSAVTDLFYEPYQGFVSDRPQDIGIGLAKVYTIGAWLCLRVFREALAL